MEWKLATDDMVVIFKGLKRKKDIRFAAIWLALLVGMGLVANIAVGYFVGSVVENVQTPLGTVTDLFFYLTLLLILLVTLRQFLPLARSWIGGGQTQWYMAKGVCTDLDQEEEYIKNRDPQIGYIKTESFYIVIQSDSGKKLYRPVGRDIYGSHLIGRRVTMGTTTPNQIQPELVYIHPPNPE